MVSRCILRKLERPPLTEVARSAVERSEQIFEGITTKCIAGDKPAVQNGRRDGGGTTRSTNTVQLSRVARIIARNNNLREHFLQIAAAITGYALINSIKNCHRFTREHSELKLLRKLKRLSKFRISNRLNREPPRRLFLVRMQRIINMFIEGEVERREYARF